MKRSTIGPMAKQLVSEIGKSGLFNHKELLKIAMFEMKLDNELKVEMNSEQLLMDKYGVIKGDRFFEQKDNDSTKLESWMKEAAESKDSEWVDIIPAINKDADPKEVPVQFKLRMKKKDIEALKEYVSKSELIHQFGAKLVLLLDEFIKDFKVMK